MNWKSKLEENLDMNCSSTAVSTVMVLLVLCGRAIAQDAVEQAYQAASQRRAVVHARALTLEEMSEEADRIFIGTVDEVSSRKVEVRDGNDIANVVVQEVAFKVEEPIKGNFQDGALRIRQLATLAQPFKKGEEVMLYLASESKLGLTAPLGVYSGHFKIKTAKDAQGNDIGKVAINLKANEGLWPRDTTLLAAEQADWRNAFQEKVNETSQGDEAQRVFQAASQPNKKGPLPLNLLKAATEAFMEVE
jgi:hypothetical protein